MTDGFHVDLNLPFHWRLCASEVCRAQQGINSSVYAILDGYDAVATISDNHTTTSSVARLEAKVDLLMALVTRLLQEQQSPPAIQAVQLSAQQIIWTGDTQNLINQSLAVQLFLDPRLPQPLTLCGIVQATTPGQICLSLQHPDDLEAAAWQRWLFRQHRHHIAKLRNPHRA